MCYACTMIFSQQRIKIGLVGAVGLLLVLFVLGQVGFNTYLRSQLYPAMEGRYGVTIQSESARFNMLTGIIEVRDLSLYSTDSAAQDPYASFGRIRVKVHPSTWWFKHPIRIRSLEISEGMVCLIRDRAGHLNVHEFELAKEKQRVAPIVAGSSTLSTRSSSQAAEWLIDEFRCGVDLHYMDHNQPEVDRLYYVALTGRSISSIEGHTWGSLHGVVELLEGERPFSGFAEAQIAPLVDLQKPTFYLTGQTELLDGAWLDRWLEDTGVEVESFRVDAQIFSKEGMLEESKLAAQLKDCSLTFSDQVYTMNQLQFSLPVEGTIQEPTIDIQAALEEALNFQISTLIGSFAHNLIQEMTQLDEPVKAMIDEVADFLEVPSQEIKNEAEKWIGEGLKQWEKLFQE